MAVDSNERGIRLTIPQAGVMVSVLSLIVFAAGFLGGYLTFKAQMEQLKYDLLSISRNLNDVQGRMNSLHNDAAQDRAVLSGRLAGLENEVKWIKEGVAELRLRSLPGGSR